MKKITSKIKKIIEGYPLALATIKNGKPYVIVLTCYKAIDGNKILFCDTYIKKTLENIKKNNNIVMVGWSKDYEGYQFFGKARYFKKGKWFKLCKKLKKKKELPCKGAILVEVNKIVKSKNK